VESKAHSLIVLTLVLFVVATGPQTRAESAPSPEYQVKAAFLYNFVKFVDWPEEKIADSNDTITIAIIGKHKFGNAFDAIKGKKVKEKAIVIKYLPNFEQTRDKDTLKKYHLLFICSSEEQHLKDIIKIAADANVLTVGDMDTLFEAGGIIQFVMQKKKVRFEINLTAAKRAKLKIRSQLLRLAKKVVEEKPPKEARN
jgi:hypothetical protein